MMLIKGCYIINKSKDLDSLEINDCCLPIPGIFQWPTPLITLHGYVPTSPNA